MKRPNLQSPHTGNPVIDRALREVYDNIARLADASSAPSVQGNPPHTKGDGGELRLVKGDDNRYYIQARFKDGWVSTAKDVMTFQNSAQDSVPGFYAGGYQPGNIPVSLEVAWGIIQGTLADQADLKAELNKLTGIAIAL